MSEINTEQIVQFLDEIFEVLRNIQDNYMKLNKAFGNLLFEYPEIGSSWMEHRQELINQEMEKEKAWYEDQYEREREEPIREPQFRKQK